MAYPVLLFEKNIEVISLTVPDEAKFQLFPQSVVFKINPLPPTAYPKVESIIKTEDNNELRTIILENLLEVGDAYFTITEEINPKGQKENKINIETGITKELQTVIEMNKKTLRPGQYIIRKNNEIIDRYVTKTIILEEDYTNNGD